MAVGGSLGVLDSPEHPPLPSINDCIFIFYFQQSVELDTTDTKHRAYPPNPESAKPAGKVSRTATATSVTSNSPYQHSTSATSKP